MTTLIISTLYALLPAYVANMAPVIAQRLNFLPRLARPLDGGHKIGRNYIFGTNKTWRGFAVGVASAMLVGVAQYFLWQFNVVRLRSVIDFSRVDPVTFGFIGGMGAMGGDLIKSFLKRRFAIASGNAWPIADQLDFVLGYFGATYFFVFWQLPILLAGLILTLIFHPLTNLIAYLLAIKKVWW